MWCQLWILWLKLRQDLRELETSPSRCSQFILELGCWIWRLRLVKLPRKIWLSLFGRLHHSFPFWLSCIAICDIMSHFFRFLGAKKSISSWRRLQNIRSARWKNIEGKKINQEGEVWSRMAQIDTDCKLVMISNDLWLVWLDRKTPEKQD